MAAEWVVGLEQEDKDQKKGNEDNAIETGTANNKKTSKSSKGLKRLTNINFEPTGKDSLKDFLGKYNPKSDKERNLLFTHYLKNTLGIHDVTFDHIYSCYDVLGLPVSINLTQTVRNTSSKTGWIEIKNSKIYETIKGGNQIKTWNKKD